VQVSRIVTKYFKNYNIKNRIDKNGQSIVHIETPKGDCILKIYSEYNLDDISILDAYYRYGKLLNDSGILTPNLILNSDSSTHKITRIKNISYISWVEEYIPSKYTYLDFFPTYNKPDDVFYELGKINGKMNRISFENNIFCTKNLSIINFENVERDYNFNSVQNILKHINVEKGELIFKIYTKKRHELENIFQTLKNGYLQGDCSPLNLIISQEDKILGFYDYNLSGNEKYIVDAINNGIFYAFEYCLEDRKLKKEYQTIMSNRFNEYMKGYFSKFKYDNDIEVVDLLYNILILTRFKMALIKNLLNNKNYGMLDYLFDWLLEQMQKSNVLY